MKYILALDIGIASVGWAVLDKESETVIEAGSNIFPEASAADNQLRRDMRGAKRNNRRLKTRINDFIKLWEKNNLSIPQFKSTEIVGLKVHAITEEITLDELYLILYSYLKHRGISYLEDVKYWHYVMRKSNRGLCNQTIRGTREYDGKQYKINKLDIRTKEGIKVFAKLAFSKKDSDRERLLVYLNDRRTFDDLCKIYEDYSDAANPFVQYEKETGDIIRKYSKKHNGPRIDKLKYKDGEVGACIDISHKYGFEKGSKKVILESLVPYRMDVYYKEENHSYYLVGVKQSDIKFEKGRNVIDEEAYARILVNEKMIQPGQSRADLENLGFKFKLSFYKNDIIEYEKDGKIYTERLVSRTMPKKRNYIETKPIDRDKHEDSKDGRKRIGLSETKLIKKFRTDILGNKYSCSEEKFTSFC